MQVQGVLQTAIRFGDSLERLPQLTKSCYGHGYGKWKGHKFKSKGRSAQRRAPTVLCPHSQDSTPLSALTCDDMCGVLPPGEAPWAVVSSLYKGFITQEQLTAHKVDLSFQSVKKSSHGTQGSHPTSHCWCGSEPPSPTAALGLVPGHQADKGTLLGHDILEWPTPCCHCCLEAGQ